MLDQTDHSATEMDVKYILGHNRSCPKYVTQLKNRLQNSMSSEVPLIQICICVF